MTELRAALTELAGDLEPSPDLLAGVQARTRGLRRRRRVVTGGVAVALLALGGGAAALVPGSATTARLGPAVVVPAPSPGASADTAGEALDPAHPWAFRGDATYAAIALRGGGLTPLWAGRVGVNDHAVLGLITPTPAGQAPATALLLLRADGSVDQRDRQTLAPGTRFLADLIPAEGTSPAQLLVLGPPGTTRIVASTGAADGRSSDAADHGAITRPAGQPVPATLHVVAIDAASDAIPLAAATVPVAALPAFVGNDEAAGTALDPRQPWGRRGTGTVRGAPAGFVTLWSGPDGAKGELAAIGFLPDGAGPGKATTLAVVDRADGTVDVGAQVPLAAGSHAVAAVISPLGAPPVVAVVATPVALTLQVQAVGSSYTGYGAATADLGTGAALIPPWQLGFPAAVLHVTPLDQRQHSLGAGDVSVSGAAALAAPLSLAHPWAVRGDVELAQVVGEELVHTGGGTSLPVWGGTIDGRAIAVELRTVGGTTSVVTIGGDAGHRVGIDAQRLTGSTQLVAVALPPAAAGHPSTLLLLGPPGGRAAADLPGASQALAQADDGTSTYGLPAGATSYTGTVTVSVGRTTAATVHVDTAATHAAGNHGG